MPRQPTGRPRGRPPGRGQLGVEGEGHTRLTVRIPTTLYNAMKAASYTQENLDLAQTVRHALEHYLSYKRQTGNVPQSGDTRGQTGNVPEPARTTADDHRKDHRRTTGAPRSEKRQTTNVPEAVGDDTRQTGIPSYDSTRYY